MDTHVQEVEGVVVAGEDTKKIKINTRALAHVRAQPPIDARNHPGDNGRGFIVLRLIHTLLSSPSHNHTIKVEVGGGKVRT